MNESIIDGKGSGDVVLVNMDDVSIKNITVTNCGNGDYDVGLRIYTDNNDISNNNIYLNPRTGIYLDNAHNNNVLNNFVDSNGASGIYLSWSNDNNIENNYILENHVGIGFWNGRRNIITGNTIESNDIGLNKDSQSVNNEIYHNNFIDNTEHASDLGGEDWDNGVEGNYWDDYYGVDDDENGIGDTSYIIDEDSQDNYPLMYVYPDIAPPVIELNSPANNSILKAGIVIDISVSDSQLKSVECSINDEEYYSFDTPYDIYTNTWVDGIYSIKVRAIDLSGKKSFREYFITIDTTKPAIILSSPTNNAIIKPGALIDISITDSNLNDTKYLINDGVIQDLYYPFNINTNYWIDGFYNIEVHANDFAGNEESRSFIFTIDSIVPYILLSSPTNNSLIKPGILLEFEISDEHLDEVEYSIDDGNYQILTAPYEINTFDWTDGEHELEIFAKDLGGNEKRTYYKFTMDSISPVVESTFPLENEQDISINITLSIIFSEKMNKTSVELSISITPEAEYLCSWNDENSILSIDFSEPLAYGTVYQFSIGTGAKDLSGNQLENKFEFQFTTEEKPTEDEEGFPIILHLAIIIIILVVVVIVAMVMAKKKKTPPDVVETLVEPIETPQPIQFTCSNCNNLLQVNDTGLAQNLRCPFCSTLLTVQSRKATSQLPVEKLQPQIQQHTIPISCPKCRYKFSVIKTGAQTKVQCPNCKASGTLRLP